MAREERRRGSCENESPGKLRERGRFGLAQGKFHMFLDRGGVATSWVSLRHVSIPNLLGEIRVV